MQYLFILLSTLLFLLSCAADKENMNKDPSLKKSKQHGNDLNKINEEDDFDTLLVAVADTLEMNAGNDSLVNSNETLPTPNLKLLLFEENGLFGYKNTKGKVILSPRYEMANDFVNGMAEVVDDQGWAYINGNGDVIARPFIYDNGPDYFREGLARFVEEDKMGFINEKGIKIIAASFDFAKPFDDGISLVCVDCKPKSITRESGENWIATGGKWGVINKNGDWVLPCQYAEVKNFGKGVVGYKEAGKWVKKTVK